jgi:hypothetical protein
MTDPRTRTAPRPAGGANLQRDVPGPAIPLPTSNRPRGYLALAIAFIVGFAALGFWLYSNAGAKVAVLVAARDIPAGHVVTADDLTTAQVAGDITAVAAGHIAEIVGRTTTVEILRSTPLQQAMVTEASPLSTGQVLVGVAVSPGQMPSSGLAAGEQVAVLRLPAPNSDGTPAPSHVLATATVYDVRANPAAAGGTLLTLIAPKTTAYSIAAASDAGLVALVQLGEGA